MATAKVFAARTENASLRGVLSTETMQVPLVPLSLVSMQALLISCSTHSAKLSFFQKAVEVVVIVEFKTMRNGGRGRMHETN